MTKDWKCEDEAKAYEIIQNNARLTQILTKFILVSYNSLILTNLLMAIDSLFSENIEDRKFAMRAYLPLRAKNSPVFEVTCAVQFILMIFGANNHAVIEGLLVATVLLFFCILAAHK